MKRACHETAGVRAFLLLLAGLSIIIAGQGTSVGAGPVERDARGGEAVVTVTNSDDGKEITLGKGETLRIALRTHATAGYSWYFDGLDEEYFEAVSAGTKVFSKRPGTPALKVWELKARKSGVVKVVMYNFRSWEGKEKAVNRFFFVARVE
jgi:predicted secreted protein